MELPEERMAADYAVALAELARFIPEMVEGLVILGDEFTTSRVPEGWPGSGKFFITYANGVAVEEGEDFPLATLPEEAVALFHDGWTAFRAANPGNTLLWRTKPTLTAFPHWGLGISKVVAHCRLLIVDVPAGELDSLLYGN